MCKRCGAGEVVGQRCGAAVQQMHRRDERESELGDEREDRARGTAEARTADRLELREWRTTSGMEGVGSALRDARSVHRSCWREEVSKCVANIFELRSTFGAVEAPRAQRRRR
mmetsp:Transcript_14466/g.38692  ORF Transcript_14466/g.38692 Transcript_14466/m.38692 type:complete len:113 (+) Transcript_14466:185-523(+)